MATPSSGCAGGYRKAKSAVVEISTFSLTVKATPPGQRQLACVWQLLRRLRLLLPLADCAYTRPSLSVLLFALGLLAFLLTLVLAPPLGTVCNGTDFTTPCSVDRLWRRRGTQCMTTQLAATCVPNPTQRVQSRRIHSRSEV